MKIMETIPLTPKVQEEITKLSQKSQNHPITSDDTAEVNKTGLITVINPVFVNFSNSFLPVLKHKQKPLEFLHLLNDLCKQTYYFCHY